MLRLAVRKFEIADWSRVMMPIRIVMVLAMMAASLPVSAASLRCDNSAKYACRPSGCERIDNTNWNMVDLDAGRFSSCDKNGCDHYNMAASYGGVFIYIDVPGREMLVKMSLDGSIYVEVVTLVTLVLVSYGTCE